MPADDQAKQELGKCQRCNERAADRAVRAQRLCSDCHVRFIQTKPVKRLEALQSQDKSLGNSSDNAVGSSRASRSQHEPEIYLLALSGGASSLSMLDILDRHIASMKAKSSRASYGLHVLHVDTASVQEDSSCTDQPSLGPSSIELVREAFPAHGFSVVGLADVLDGWSPLRLHDDDDDISSRTERLLTLQQRAKTPTAREDFQSMLVRRSILKFAHRQGYRTVLMGDSTTRISERIIGETAKGRGGSLPGLLSESYQPVTNLLPGLSTATSGLQSTPIRVAFPMRDLLRTDVDVYSSSTTAEGPSGVQTLADMADTTAAGKEVVQPPTMMRHTPIGLLVSRYLEGVEAGFPNIVSNVARTVGKLDASGGMAGGGPLCGCCGGRAGDVGGGIGTCARCAADFGA